MWSGSVPNRSMDLKQDVGDGFDVRSLAVTYREGHSLSDHTHPWAQLIFARSGMMNVDTDGQLWFVPPTKAVWVPANVPHRIRFKGEVAMRTLYVSERRADAVQRQVQTLEVSPLLHHLVEHIHRIKMLDPQIPGHDHLAAVLVDLILEAPVLDLVLPCPKDARAAHLAEYLRENPTDKRVLKELAADSGASLRTMQRHFSEQTGLSLDVWRQKARLVHSFSVLAAGKPVSVAASESGFESSSAFIAAFKKHFGTTPGKIRTGAG